jgi:hypothetical protein
MDIDLDATKNNSPAADEAIKEVRLRVAKQDADFKELKDKILKDQQEELYRMAAASPPLVSTPAKKADKPQTINNINITRQPLVLPEQKQPWHKNLFWQLFALVGSLLVALLGGYLLYRLGWN